MKSILFSFFLLGIYICNAQRVYVKDNFDKLETTITMRDGIRLYTIIYTPKDKTKNYPILMERTPYSCGPYDSTYATSLGPNDSLLKEGYIFVIQDVRGRYRSEGINLEVTPHIAQKKSNKDVDESSDTYDTIDWLIKNIPNNNGRVGIHGISYPGFYATASLPNAHPALKAVSPQAPVTDEFIGDDANHNGAFFLMDNFNFIGFFDRQWNDKSKNYEAPYFNSSYRDAYKFFLQMNTISETNSNKYYGGKSRIWNEYISNDTYNAYWKSRNIRQHLKNINIPTLVVGGWFDAENLFGALRTYEALDRNNPQNKNYLVMGPWTHGAWSAPDWTIFATHHFGSNTAKYFQDNLETSFFNYYLKDKGTMEAGRAFIFETGSNIWKTYNNWPPKEAVATSFYLNNSILTKEKPGQPNFLEYLSDPNKPVPYTGWITRRRDNEYMADDQRFASQRPDVLVYESEPLEKDLTVSGPITANLTVSLSSTDADFVVKLIDVLPDTTTRRSYQPSWLNMSGFQRLVRAEIMRGKFRNSFEKPTAFVPNKKEKVSYQLPDVSHTFKKGHRIMIQIQSSWFPLADRNPQQFMSIPKAKPSDFKKATIKLFNDSHIVLPILN